MQIDNTQESKGFDIKDVVNVPLYLGESKVGTAPHIPKADAPLIMEMNVDERIVKRFGETIRNLEETEESLDPQNDVKIYQDLLDPRVSFENSSVIEHRIERTAKDDTDKDYKEMVGWVAIYRSSPKRIPRFFSEKLLDPQQYDIDKHPVLELSYARHKDAPKGIKEAVGAELYRLYEIALNSADFNNKSIIDNNLDKINELAASGVEVQDQEKMSYNDICPIRVIATIDIDNFSSINMAEDLGFVKKGITIYETPTEAEDPTKVNGKDEFLYELDWDKFIKNIGY